MMYWGDWPGWGWMMFWMALIWTLILGVVIVAIRAWVGPRQSAEDILKQRLAAGEIDEKEFEERRRLLQAA